ncbi:hypothetical protein AB4Y38_40645, partial [Paraburkholderia sp. EG285A]
LYRERPELSGVCLLRYFEHRFFPSFGSSLHMTYWKAKFRGKLTRGETAKYLQTNAGAWYNLSKRTLFYATTSWERALGIDSTGKPAVAALAFLTPSSTNNQVAVRVGVRHVF